MIKFILLFFFLLLGSANAAVGVVAIIAAASATAIATSVVVIAAIGVIGAAILGAVVAYGISVLAGKALGLDKKPSIEDTATYAQNKLKNIKTNTATVPLIYGRNRIGGNIIWQRTGGASNVNLHQIIVLGYDDIESIEKVYVGNEELELRYSETPPIYPTYSSTGDFIHVVATAPKTIVIPSNGPQLPTGDYTNIPLASHRDSLLDIYPNVNLFTDGIKVTSNMTPLAGTLAGLTTPALNDAPIFDPNDAETGYIKYDFGSNKTIRHISIEMQTYNLPPFVGNVTKVSKIAKISVSKDDITYTTLNDNIFLDKVSCRLVEDLQDLYLTILTNGARYIKIEGFTPTDCFSTTDGFTINKIEAHEEYFGSKFYNFTSYITVLQKYNNPDNTQAKEINAIVKGKKIRTITNSTTISPTLVYSNNPSEVLLDLLLSDGVDILDFTYSLGLNVPESKIDIESFYNVKQKCDVYGFECNIVFTTSTTIQQMINEVLTTSNIKLSYYNGKYYVYIPEKQRTSYVTLTEDDILKNSLTVAMVDTKNLTNKVTIRYINPNSQWQVDEVRLEDEDLLTLDGDLYEETIDIKGCTDESQAQLISKLILSQLRYTGETDRIKRTPVQIGFSIESGKHADLSLNTIVTYTIFGITKTFDIIRMIHKQDGTIDVLGIEYSNQAFKDENNNFII